MPEELKFDEKYCSTCGVPIKKDAIMCPKCGVKNTVPTTGKSKTTAGILGILLGGVGAHKFYLGKTGLGILYLVFFWTLIPGIAGLIEGIIYLTSNQENFDAKYNKA